MDLYLYVILTIICVSPIFTSECPDRCECKMFPMITINSEVQSGLQVHCVTGLRGVPRDNIGSDVTYLDLSSNQIQTLANVDENAKNMTEIKQLILEKNQITKIEVNSLRGFNWLECLDISINNISDLPSDLFKNMPKLDTLRLSQNPFLILPENGFDIKILRRLYIRSCNLKDIPLKFFDKMPELKFLHLEGNHITHLGDHLISQFKKMIFVNLEHNNLTVFQPKIADLFIESDLLIGLNYNPFICDCQLRFNYELYKAHYLISDSNGSMLRASKHELQCEIPTESNKTLKSIEDQEDYFNSLGCNTSSSKDTNAAVPKTSVTNKDTPAAVLKTTTTNKDTTVAVPKTSATNKDTTAAVPKSSTTNKDTTAAVPKTSATNKATTAAVPETSTKKDFSNYEEYYTTYFDDLMWYTNHTALWTALGLVVVIGLCVGIIVMVKRRRQGVEFSNQIGLLRSELEAREEDYVGL